MNAVLKPKALRRGDVVGLVSPAGAVWESVRIDHAVRYLEGRGYRVEVGAHARGNDGAFAASDLARHSAAAGHAVRAPRRRGPVHALAEPGTEGKLDFVLTGGNARGIEDRVLNVLQVDDAVLGFIVLRTNGALEHLGR
jgi:hypothetical protein